jgi:hypothetical protein
VIRARIIDPKGKELVPGLGAVCPEQALPHIGKEGVVEWTPLGPRITLDDGTVLMGSECWWERV